ncbi:MAG: hypothetical protein ACRDZ9_02165 [Acidimicrobiales bacterium]
MRSFPEPLRGAFSQDATRDAMARAIERPAVRDLGPDLGLGL